MEAVASFKWANSTPIADPERETALVKDMERKANGSALSQGEVRRFFQAQIEAAKIVQHVHMERWKSQSAEPPEAVNDLRDIRVKIDRINEKLLQALVDTHGQRWSQDEIEKRASELLQANGIDSAAREEAIRPLLKH